MDDRRAALGGRAVAKIPEILHDLSVGVFGRRSVEDDIFTDLGRDGAERKLRLWGLVSPRLLLKTPTQNAQTE
jgi:hypothetical protein